MTRAKRQISLGDRVWNLEIERDGTQLEVRIDGESHRFEIRPGPGSRVELWAQSNAPPRPVRGHFVRDGDHLWVHAGRTRCFTLERADHPRRISGGAVSDQVHAPMTGTVRKVLVVAEEAVSKGQPLVVLEAMKMEHVLRAPRDGVVAEVSATEGSQAEAHAVLVRLLPASP